MRLGVTTPRDNSAMPDDAPFHLRCDARPAAALAELRALLPWRLTRCIPMEVYRAA